MTFTNRLLGAAAAILLLSATTACSATSAPVNASGASTATQAPAAGATLTAVAIQAAIHLPNTVLLDVRTPAEYDQGHLAGAVNLDLNSSGFAGAVAALEPTKRYAVYCRSGTRSQTAMSIMQSQGIDEVYHLGGGIAAWTAAGGVVVRG
ncbi:MAG: rhodanese-like domain-containing protein [Micropruina sp.]